MVMPAETSVEKMLALLRQNNPAALGILFERYGRRLVSYARNRWHFDEDAAWEIIYQTFDVLLLKFGGPSAEPEKLTFSTDYQVDSYVFGVFTNKLREADRRRQQDKERYVPMTVLEPATDEDDDTEAGDSPDEPGWSGDWPDTTSIDSPNSRPVERVNRALATLPPTDRDLLLLWAQGYTYAEIATMLKIDPKDLKVRCFRAKQKVINWFNTNS
jgi:RNA polymerase sigma factor (sigma-70 family)